MKSYNRPMGAAPLSVEGLHKSSSFASFAAFSTSFSSMLALAFGSAFSDSSVRSRSAVPKASLFVVGPEAVFKFRKKSFFTGFFTFDPIPRCPLYFAIIKHSKGSSLTAHAVRWILQSRTRYTEKLYHALSYLIKSVVLEMNVAQCHVGRQLLTLLLAQICLHRHHQGEEVVIDRKGARMSPCFTSNPLLKRLLFVQLRCTSTLQDRKVVLEGMTEPGVLWHQIHPRVLNALLDHAQSSDPP